ncbi:hypothetical protein [Thiorhodovibrio winogradskyi]|uniref:hypothetical protein n=1 Tax=Thiorhodovibrio winogradskyi TaxID=77007 RepID=UPI002E2BAE66|nr:hypothetical protein [Thiorhodovibrio winogradskyi]
MRQAAADRASLAYLAQQTIQLPTGERVPLDAVASVREQRDWARITRIDGQRRVTLQAEVDARQASGQAIVADLRARWLDDFQARHPEVRVSFEGQLARSAETDGSIRRGLLIRLLPLLAETSTQADAIKPLVVSVVFGLLSATVLVLLVLPALYVVSADWGGGGWPAGIKRSRSLMLDFPLPPSIFPLPPSPLATRPGAIPAGRFPVGGR